MAQRIRKIPENTSVDEGSNDAASTASQAASSREVALGAAAIKVRAAGLQAHEAMQG